MESLTKRISLGASRTWAVTLTLMMGTVACGPVDDAPAPVAAPGIREQQLAGNNGLTRNGLTRNGLTRNGLTRNGLTRNGLESADFATWFSADPELGSTVMQYVVRCAVPEGQTLSYQDAATGITYTWEGVLGLAPGWAGGQDATQAEQQIVSACLAAHVNKYGVHVPLSVLGRTAQQQAIPYTAEELQSFPRREGCFFGNLFTDEGVFAGVDGEYLYDGESSPRACALSTSQDELVSQCSPITHVQSCETLCTLDPSGLFYTQCTYNGRSYLPVTTRIRAEDINTCGDGVCQFTESCGTGSEANNCLSDCGACE